MDICSIPVVPATKIATEAGKVGNNQPSSATIIERGRASLTHIERGHWLDWRNIIEALAAGRTNALLAAGTNAPQGREYRDAMGRWLRCHGFDRINKSDRVRLLKCADNLAAIDEWRDGLPPDQQLRFNHPRTVWTQWNKSLRDTKNDANASSKPASSAQIDIWNSWTPEQRRSFLASVGLDALLAAMPKTMVAEINRRIRKQDTRAHPKKKTFPTLEQALSSPRDVGPNSADEIERKLARQPEAETARLKPVNAALESEIDELKKPPEAEIAKHATAGEIDHLTDTIERLDGSFSPSRNRTSSSTDLFDDDWRRLLQQELEDRILAIRRTAVHTHLTPREWRALDRMRKRASALLLAGGAS